ncbi:MAG: hypothetical protein MI807_02925 [Verrucomicrobiales bacterium]|nr:hypothetical protein [Verrucomicrobiales bacterium]
MKAIFPLTLALSCFVTVGNSQDSAERPTYGPAATAFDTQGNVAYNMSTAERELAAAAQQARRMKELMYERASQNSAPPRPVPRTAAEYLAANPPPPMPEPLQPRNPVRTNRDYVPPFNPSNSPITPEQGAVATNNAPAPDFGMPKKEGGFFKLFGKKKQQETSLPEAPVGASGYETGPYVAPDSETGDSTPEPAPASPPAEMDESARDQLIREAVVNPDAAPEPQVGNGRKEGFFGKLFKKRNNNTSEPAGSTPEAVPAPATDMAATDAPAAPAPPSNTGDIPDPVAFDAPAPPAPPAATPPPAPDGPAPIFQRNNANTTSGTPAAVSGEATAMVNGVKVKLYPGTNVSVLSNSGGTAQIRLPDGRTGTVDSGSLQ